MHLRISIGSEENDEKLMYCVVARIMDIAYSKYLYSMYCVLLISFQNSRETGGMGVLDNKP